MEKIFILRENTNNVRNFQKISNENRTTVKQGIEAISNKIHLFWQIFSMNINWELSCMVLN